MGFYVNLEIPKDCPMCPFANYDMFNTFMGCNITRGKRWAVKNDKDYAESSTKPDWCPLIEVPEPHGRLIDADEPISLIDTRGEKVEVTVAHIIEKNRGIVKAIIPASLEAE